MLIVMDRKLKSSGGHKATSKSKATSSRISQIQATLFEQMKTHRLVGLASGLAESLRVIAARLDDLVAARNSGAIDEGEFEYAFRNKAFGVLETTVSRASTILFDDRF